MPTNTLDEIIGDVLTSLKARGVPYTAVYTALKPSHVSIAFMGLQKIRCFHCH